ncbi:MAG: hypothetical protein RL357_1569 [Pseudomonadota bacterium]
MKCRFALALIAALTASSAPAATSDLLGDWLVQHKLVQQWEAGRAKIQSVASELALNAMGLLDVPYKWGGNSPLTGLDCSGFVQAVYEGAAGISLPRHTSDQARATQPIAPHAMEAGDLVFFNTANRPYSHVGIYLGDGKFIHSPRTGALIRVEHLDVSYWKSRFDGARRVVSH